MPKLEVYSQSDRFAARLITVFKGKAVIFMPESLLRAICIATLGASFFGFSRATPVHAQSEHELPKAADLASVERRMQAAYQQIAPAIVRITYGTRNNRDWTRGSGVIVTADGHVVTTDLPRSVVQDDLLAFHLPDGRRVRGKALGWSSEWEIGLLKITERGPWSHVDFGKGADVKVGQLCVALGYPDLTGIEPDLWPAIRSGFVTRSAAPTWLTSSCLLKVHGHGVFDLDGQLIGLTSSFPVSQGDHLHTSVEMIRNHWDDLVAGKNLDRVRLPSFETEVGESPLAPRSESQPGAEKDRVAAVIEKAKAASVRIVRTAGDERGWSGTIVTADGYVITCGHHERLPGEKVTICLPDGRDASAVILGTNLVSDVGLLKITDEGPWPQAELGHSAIMSPGDACLLMGYPMNRPDLLLWISEARIVQPTNTLPAKDEWYPRFWTSGDDTQLTGLGGGSSGGGVFDLQGRIVGVILGGHGAGGKQYRRHARVELFHKQWDLLAASKTVDVFDSDPLAEIMAALRRVAADLPPIAVEVLVDGKPRVLGTIVGSDGRILTKASELGDAVSCRLSDGRVHSAEVQKVFKEHDLVLLKIDAVGLPEAPWSADESITAGTLIAALIPGQAARPGLVSLAARARSPANAGLGVILGNRDGNDGLEVHGEHGFGVPLLKGDVVVHVEDRPTPDYDAYLALFQPKSGTPIAYAGDTVRVGVRRGGDTLELRFALPPSNSWDYGAGTTSRRWWGFPSVFSTDIRLTPQQCGAPVIDKSGHVVGIAIACQGEPGNWGQRHVIPAPIARDLVVD